MNIPPSACCADRAKAAPRAVRGGDGLLPSSAWTPNLSSRFDVDGRGIIWVSVQLRGGLFSPVNELVDRGLVLVDANQFWAM